MHASQAIAQAGGPATQSALPGTDHVLAELGSVYPVVAYWGVEEAGAEESAPASDDQELGELLDEVIFASIVALR